MTGSNNDPDKARRRRSIAIALALGALVVLFYIMTMMRVHP
ncbi:MAG TPA: hypothetical protein VG387_11345 [Rhizomicrobium sp.]|jgi:hypothetical protein|nr:hypothetical protein [Rhizomicrobium sp.]